MYSRYTNYLRIWFIPPYSNTAQVALSYLAPETGFILTACIIVPFNSV